MRSVIITLTFVIFSKSLFSQHTIQFLSYQSDISLDNFKSLANTLSSENKKQITEISILKYNKLKTNQEPINWKSARTFISYRELYSECNNEFCKTLLDDISRYKKGSRNVLLICGNIGCSNFNTETMILPSNSSDQIITKISNEIKLNKKSPTNFIVVFPSELNKELTAKFEDPQIVLNKGEGKILNPMIETTGNVQYIWSPTEGLSCSNCKNPIASPTVNTKYSFKIKDQNGCESQSAFIDVKVDDKRSTKVCECSSSDFEFRLISENECKEITKKFGESYLNLEYKEKSPCNNKKLDVYKNKAHQSTSVFEIPFKGRFDKCVKLYSWSLYPEHDKGNILESGDKLDIEEWLGKKSGGRYKNANFYTLQIDITSKFSGDKKDWPERLPCNFQNQQNKDVIYTLEITFYNTEGVSCGEVEINNLHFNRFCADKY